MLVMIFASCNHLSAHFVSALQLRVSNAFVLSDQNQVISNVAVFRKPRLSAGSKAYQGTSCRAVEDFDSTDEPPYTSSTSDETWSRVTVSGPNLHVSRLPYHQLLSCYHLAQTIVKLFVELRADLRGGGFDTLGVVYIISIMLVPFHMHQKLKHAGIPHQIRWR